jgi:hypothetical protein
LITQKHSLATTSFFVDCQALYQYQSPSLAQGHDKFYTCLGRRTVYDLFCTVWVAWFTVQRFTYWTYWSPLSFFVEIIVGLQKVKGTYSILSESLVSKKLKHNTSIIKRHWVKDHNVIFLVWEKSLRQTSILFLTKSLSYAFCFSFVSERFKERLCSKEVKSY